MLALLHRKALSFAVAILLAAAAFTWWLLAGWIWHDEDES
jgi:hypothetical protein